MGPAIDSDKVQRGWALARKALNQWLDAPDERVPQAVFIVGCQRSGTTMMLDTVMRAPDLWVHREKSPIVYDDYRLRAPGIIDWITRHTPARAVFYKPLCDSHLTDRILDAHPNARVIWVVRRYPDVARSAVAKWGDHQRDVILAIARGQGSTVGWRGERLPPALVEQLRALVDEVGSLTPEAGAALFWYVRNSFFFALDLDRDPRVLLVRYEDLVRAPVEAFGRLFGHLGLPFDPAITADVVSSSVRDAPLDLPEPIAAVCDALQARFDAVLEGR